MDIDIRFNGIKRCMERDLSELDAFFELQSVHDCCLSAVNPTLSLGLKCNGPCYHSPNPLLLPPYSSGTGYCKASTIIDCTGIKILGI